MEVTSERSFELPLESLAAGERFRTRVRSAPGGDEYKGHWGPWSNEVHWRTPGAQEPASGPGGPAPAGKDSSQLELHRTQRPYLVRCVINIYYLLHNVRENANIVILHGSTTD